MSQRRSKNRVGDSGRRHPPKGARTPHFNGQRRGPSSRNQRRRNFPVVRGIVLDFFPFGRQRDSRRYAKTQPIALILEEKNFTLLEVEFKEGSKVEVQDEILSGKNGRDVHHVRRISYNDLTPAAKEEISLAVETIVSKNEKMFVKFFNEARPITFKLHQLMLLHGIGNKRLWKVLESRKRQFFESFDDIRERAGISDLKGIISSRILQEIESPQKYRLFTPVPRAE